MKLKLFLLIFLILKENVSVPKYKIKSISPLANYKSEINNIKISAIEKTKLYSLAIPKNGIRKATTTIIKTFHCQLPPTGSCSVSREHKLKILALSTDQIFLYFGHQDIIQIETNLKALEKSFYITEQSDAWSGIKVSGQNIISCLERICPINLSIDAFGINCFARTAMEHLNTIIIRTKKNEFELFSASSSAQSFLHTVKTSAQNI